MNILATMQRIGQTLPLIGIVLLVSAFTSWPQTPELIVQTGHASEIQSVAFSPDGKLLASGSRDVSVKLWDVATGQELRTFTGQTNTVESVVFSPDGKILASGGSDGSVKLWNVESGLELFTLRTMVALKTLVFDRDGKTLTVGSLDTTVKQWDLATQKELSARQMQSQKVDFVALSPDGKTFAAGGRESPVVLWDVGTGQQRPLKDAASFIYSFAFDRDGRILASWDVSQNVTLWDVATGEKLRTLDGKAANVTSIAFTPDGRQIATASYAASTTLWDVATGEAHTLTGESHGAIAVVFNTQDTMLASGGYDKTIRLWNPATSAEIRKMRGHSDRLFAMALSPDGNTLATGSDYAAIKLWNLDSGSEMRTLRGNKFDVSSVAFSPDGGTLASGSWDKTVRLWNVASGENSFSFPEQSDRVLAVAFSPDGKTIASGNAGNGKNLKLWNVLAPTLKPRTLEGHPGMITSLAFSGSGRMVASGSFGKDDNKGEIKFWNFATGLSQLTLGRSADGIASISISPDGKTMANSSPGFSAGNVKLWNVVTGKELSPLKGHPFPALSVAFSSDGKMLASGGAGFSDNVKLWNVADSTELRSMTARSIYVNRLAFARNNRFLIAGCFASVEVLDVNSGKDLVSLIAIDDDDWIAVTPEGFFDGSPGAWKQLFWRFDNNTFNYVPVEAFFKEFYRPGLLKDILDGKAIDPPQTELAKIDIRQPKVEIAAPGGTATADRSVKVRVEVTDNKDKARQTGVTTSSGAQDLRLFRNGSLVRVWHGDVLKGKDSVTLEATVPVVAGDNNLTAYAFNRDNVKSTDAMLLVKGADNLKRKGVAYVLAIGVTDYSNKDFDLGVADADADDFGAEFKRQQDRLGTFDHVEVVTLKNNTAVKANILKAISDIAAKIRPEDSLTMYFAGHGIADQNRFYMIPHDIGYTGPRKLIDDAGFKTILLHGISDVELEQAVEGIDAGQMLLVIDACNSGQALETEEKRRGPMNSKGLAQLAYEKGMYILTAAQSYQAAKESKVLGHGFLTSALVEDGLKKGLADRQPKDGQILLREWLDYAAARVPQMQGAEAARKRQLEREKGTTPTKNATNVSDSVQRPRVFYRRETEPHPLVVARP